MLEILQRTGIEFIISKNNDSEESFFQQLYHVLPTCQALILFQTKDALNTRRVQMVIRNAHSLTEQKKMQGIFRFICPPSANTVVPQDWQDLTTFDGTGDYQQACRDLVFSLLASTPNIRGTAQTVKTPARAILPRVSLPQKPAQTHFANPSERRRLLETEPTAALPTLPDTSFPQPSAPINSNRLFVINLQMMMKNVQYKYKNTKQKTKIIILIFIVLIIITIILSALIPFLLNAGKSI